MRELAVIVPSKTVSNLIPCLTSVLHCEPNARIFVIDDGLEFENAELRQFVRSSVTMIAGIKEFRFPRNVNLGLVASGDADCIVLNDDALIETPGGFSLMQQAAELVPEYGLISSTTNIAGNRDQFRAGVGLRETDRALAFVCVLIPRRTIDAIGMMDERFGGFLPDGREVYGFCDQDYTRRTRMAGFKIGVHDGCFVDHSKLRSTFRGDPYAGGDIRASSEVYMAKWGDLS